MALVALALGVSVQQYLKSDFQTVAGTEVSWKSLEGEWVIVNFFAEWCAPCLQEVPELNKFHAMNSQRPVHLFAVSYDALTHDELLNIKQKYDMQFPIMRTEPMPNLPMQKPQQLPATYIISPKGEVLKKLLGEQTAESLTQALKHYQDTIK